MYLDDGVFVVDGERYASENEAYDAVKRLYNKSLCKAGRRRLGVVGNRKWVISRRGIDFNDEYVQKLHEEFGGTKKVRCYIIGLFDISYGYIFDASEFDSVVHEFDDEKFQRYLDWLFCSKTTSVRTYGKSDKLVKKKYGGIVTGYYVANKRKRNTHKKNGRKKHRETGRAEEADLRKASGDSRRPAAG